MWLCVAFLGAAVECRAQEVAMAQAFAENQPQPEMVFKTTSHDFGTFHKGDKKSRTYSFEFTNEGTAPLVVTHSSSSCKCIEVRLPKRPVVAGQSGVVEIIYSPKERGGFNKAVRIYSNTPGGVLTLFVSGQVE